MRLAWALSSWLVLSFALDGVAHAEPRPKVECKRAAERAQKYRNEGKLLQARDELHVCVRPVCPAVVRSYCTRWFVEVEADLPSVVIKVRDGAGNDLSDADVKVDGVLVDAWREGLPIPLDPGAHSLEYTRAGSEPVQTSVLLGVAEKHRVLSVTLDTEPQASEPAAQAALYAPPAGYSLSEPEPEPEPRARPSKAAWVVGAATLAAWGSFAYFGLAGQSELRELEERCGGKCDASEVDAAWSKLIVADVSLGLAVIGTGLSTWLFVSSTRKGARDDRRPGQVTLTPAKHGLSLGLSGRF
jgi:hypothetical protein